MQITRFSIALLLAGALALGACGSSKSSGTKSTGGSSSTSTTKSANGIQVQMKGIAFQPGTITVKVGQTITWTNEDSVQHDVVSTSGEKIQSSLFGKGGTFSFTPKKAGTIAYVCTVHPGMKGTIVVKK
jgi:plastocyanin